MYHYWRGHRQSRLLPARSQVTGGSGYVAAHIISQLLKAGYRVRTYVGSYVVQFFVHDRIHLYLRSTARGGKVALLRDRLTALGFSNQAEVVDIPDISIGDFPLDGVSAVIHTASALFGWDATAPEIMDVRRLLRPIVSY